MSTNFDNFLEQQLSDPELRREYDAQQPEHAIIQTMIDARKHAGMTQKELAIRTGIAQSDICKLEKRECEPIAANPSTAGIGDGHDPPYRILTHAGSPV